MRVNMYNMEFGDCFLICDENENLLVDFGSDNSHCDISAVASHIKAINGDKELSCLISHFHEDHISGFLQSSLVAKDIYIPDIIAMSKTVGKLSFLQLSILSDIFKWISVNQKGKLSITLYDFLLKIGNWNEISQEEYAVLSGVGFPEDKFTQEERQFLTQEKEKLLEAYRKELEKSGFCSK